MGGSQSKVQTPAAADAAAAAADAELLNWGAPPTAPVPEEQRALHELVLQTWASCRSKPTASKSFRSDVEERERRDSQAWRKRTSFVELDCGEDSFFVSNTYKTIGIADGVGGWRDQGVDPGQFSNELMRLGKMYSETHRADVDPEKILDIAHRRILKEGKVAAGSSTALCASLRVDPASQKTYLDVANLGDSGALVVRNGEVVHRVHEKVHGFNAPFQLAAVPKSHRGRCFDDKMSMAVRESFEVKDGDVIVLGTDGLFDNRYPTQVAADAALVGKAAPSTYESVPLIGPLLSMAFGPTQKTDFADPYRVAQRIVQQAYKASISKEGDTPWSRALSEFGVKDYQGGKVDDITVVLSRVTTRDNARNTTMW